MGYHGYYHGQKAHYGVAFLTKEPLDTVIMGFPGDAEDAQKRMIIGSLTDAQGDTVTVLNGYFPQGENREQPWKLHDKKKFLDDLQDYIMQHFTTEDHVMVIGDVI